MDMERYPDVPPWVAFKLMQRSGLDTPLWHQQMAELQPLFEGIPADATNGTAGMFFWIPIPMQALNDAPEYWQTFTHNQAVKKLRAIGIQGDIGLRWSLRHHDTQHLFFADKADAQHPRDYLEYLAAKNIMPRQEYLAALMQLDNTTGAIDEWTQISNSN